MLGEMCMIVGLLMCIPLFVSVGLHENLDVLLGFIIAVAICLVLGIGGLIARPKNPEDKKMTSVTGFIVCGISWIIVCFIGAIPYRVSGYIPNYIDALFETVSGFTTTGCSVVPDIESFPMSILLWRSLTQWLGGMGVLVFVIALLPKNDKMSTAIVKAELPGHEFGKLVGKMRTTSQILYAFYIVFTLILAGILCAFKMPVFDSFCHAFSTASTGGFSIKTANIAYYNNVGIDVTITIFMLLFSVNFNVFYLVLIQRMLKALKNEELISMLVIVFVTTIIVCATLLIYGTFNTFGEDLRYSSFMVVSMLSTTGFVNTPVGEDFTFWPAAAQTALAAIMIIGGSSGSTAGGIKISRFLVVAKSNFLSMRKFVVPRSVGSVKLNGKPLNDDVVNNITTYFLVYVAIFVTSVFLMSINSQFNGIRENLTSVLECLSNVGLAFGELGPMNSFAGLTAWHKLVLCADMLLGRLEIIPILILFYPAAWKPYRKRRQNNVKKEIAKQ